MRTAHALASAVVAVALVACAYDVPNVVARSGDAGGQGTDDGGFVSPDGASSSGSDSGWSGSNGGDGGGSGSSGGGDAAGASDAPCTGTLCACNNASDCASHICAQSLTVGTSLYAAANNKNFCTQACCTSADCAAGTVCFASGQGGNYCVNPSWIGRAVPGAGPGGASCSNGGQCRSGLCSGGACADTCCSLAASASECSGLKCTFGVFPGASGIDAHFTARCGPARGSYATGLSCSGDDQCQGGLCVNDGSGAGPYCTNPCRTDADCGSGGACLIGAQGIDLYFACFPSNGLGTQGSSCTTDSQCAGYWCGTGNKCTDVCVTDADCITGWRCTPQPDNLPTGEYLVLGCGP
jgi:hypothetical protein